ncbi:hypothetical protein [Synechococcus sp. PROS-U-1]|uniref:hypothetical protein n=1 Tax=Synechococcus sp. PROS-U-1 TaxID=1400866 RepID=UPI001648D3CB|nr:hypothetical protein [Synechococcus sp. PROS-U-1]QNJ03203.1 hypothetical protein SynPROSU1_01603 [Synechococcus sp. PROS-U-1]
MGFLDRLLKKDSAESDSTIEARKPAKEKPAEFFLDADSSSSLGDVNYMRESKTIRRTFPGTVDSPGTKEQVMEVAAETGTLEKRSEGLGGVVKRDESVTLNAGVPKPVKKTFAEQVSTEEMSKRLKGTAITGVNAPAPADAAPVGRKEELKATQEPAVKVGSAAPSSKPGSIDPFRQMVRDLNK